MASGLLATTNIASATTNTLVYTVPASKLASCNMNLCNRTGSAVTVRLGVVPSGDTIGADHWIEYDTSIPANGVLERTGFVLAAGDKVYVYASASSAITCVITGIEEAA